MNHHFYMDLALAEARKALAAGEVPIGAVIVEQGKILAQAHNLKEQLHDPTAHAEILAIRRAAEKRGSWRLTGCTLYVTVEPCPMCAGAIVQSRIERLVYGVADLKAGAVESIVNLVQNKYLNHYVEVFAGIREEECKNIMREFFESKRN
ncbi:tRNA adenosine(34) deaminase TadA [Zhaonella formicivorans]|uniref:tRNA adenosine(34) deaminase TadA n=1 Tax=Zhaonella formicivorans TaxID=2528593 RepID=UPI001D11D03B